MNYKDRAWSRTARLLASRFGTPVLLTTTLALAGGASLLLNQSDGQAAQARVVPAIQLGAPAIDPAQACAAMPRYDGDQSFSWHDGDRSDSTDQSGLTYDDRSGTWRDGGQTFTWHGGQATTLSLVYSGCPWNGLQDSTQSQP